MTLLPSDHVKLICSGRQLDKLTMAEDEDQEGQALYADDEGEVNNPDPNEFDERPAECTPFGPTPYFELVSDFFEKLQDMRGKRTAKGAKGSAEKKRALVQHMFNVSIGQHTCRIGLAVSCQVYAG